MHPCIFFFLFTWKPMATTVLLNRSINALIKMKMEFQRHLHNVIHNSLSMLCLYFFRDVNNNIMEMLIMAYACKTSSARSIVGVIPYLPYSKQCKMRKRGCIVSKLLAKVCSLPFHHVFHVHIYNNEYYWLIEFPQTDDVQIRSIAYHHHGFASEGNPRILRLPRG